MMRLDLNELLQPEYCNHLVRDTDFDNVDAELVLDDGTIVRGRIRKLMTYSVFWRPYRMFNVPITVNSVQTLDFFDRDADGKLCDKTYADLIAHGVPSYRAIEEIYLAKTWLYRWIMRWCRKYQGTIDLIQFAKLAVQKPIEALMHLDIKNEDGSAAAEKQLDEANRLLHNYLADPNGPIKDNFLLPFLQTGLLKRNQVPQVFVAYGPRSDITDNVMKSIVAVGALHGYRNVDDYATEALAAKKSTYFNARVVDGAQYFARMCRLDASKLNTILPYDCGSKVRLPMLIKDKFKGHFIGKFVELDGKPVRLTRSNIKNFVGQTVNFYTPFGCKCTTGTCRACAGYMHGLIDMYTPPAVQVGIFCATILVSEVTQLVLSAKHLVRTLSKIFHMSESAMRQLFLHNGDIVLQAKLAKVLDVLSIRISNTAIRNINDLTLQHTPVPETFSYVKEIQFFVNGEFVDSVDVGNNKMIPYLSHAMLQHMRKNIKKITKTDYAIDIPLSGFDLKKPFLQYTVMNDDMVSYVESVRNFMGTKIKDYHNIPQLMDDFSELIYRKAHPPFFFLEMMVKSFMATDVRAYDWQIPAIHDINQTVDFAGLSDAISHSALSTKLSFEGLNELWTNPMPAIRRMPKGVNDRLFGW